MHDKTIQSIAGVYIYTQIYYYYSLNKKTYTFSQLGSICFGGVKGGDWGSYSTRL